MAYQIKFSDLSKTNDVTVPDMPPGINTVDTSLSLVGKAYPNYGEKIAENFLHLLENFASPLPPENPIEGQLWYDTSNQNRKVLRIMDGTADTARWPLASGIYQQGSDPRNYANAAIKVGDIWVDTTANQLKIYGSGDWTVVGPSTSSADLKTGPETVRLQDATTSTTYHNVILNWANGQVVSIVSSDSEFKPRIISAGMEGFTTIKPGITLRSRDTTQSDKSYILNGVAYASRGIEVNNQVYSADRILIKDSPLPQVVTSRVVFPSVTGIAFSTSGTSTEYQLYKSNNDVFFVNAMSGGKVVLRVKEARTNTLHDTLIVSRNFVGINTGTNSTPSNPLLDVYGSARILNTLTVGRLLVEQDIVSPNVEISGNLKISGITTCSGTLSLGLTSGNGSILLPNSDNSYDIGSTDNYFRTLYVSSIASPMYGTVVYGTVKGSATYLESSTEFRMQGQASSPPFLFNGGGDTATFVVSLARDAIDAQPTVDTLLPTHTLLVLNTATSVSNLEKISKKEFLKDLVPTGTIMLYGGDTQPDGWLFCDGSPKSKETYSDLYGVIGINYGDFDSLNFNLPSIPSVSPDVGPPMMYIIKT